MATPTSGYIKIFRSLFSNPIWTSDGEFDIRSAWIDMIQRAAFSTTFVIRKSKSIPIEVGCFAASERELQRDWHCSRDRVRQYIGIFVSMGCVSKYSYEGTTIFRLNNYAELNSLAGQNPPSRQPNYNQTATTSIYNIQRRAKERNTPSIAPAASDAEEAARKKNGDGAGAPPSAYAGTDGGGLAPSVAPGPDGGTLSVGVGAGCDEVSGRNFMEAKNGAGGACVGGSGGCAGHGRRPAGGAEAARSAWAAPSLQEWGAYAVSIGWDYSEEYTSCWGHFQKTANARGQWRSRNGLVITDWRLHCREMAEFWAKKNGRRRNNFRTIDECIGDGLEPPHWRQEYCAQFKMKDIADVDNWYPSWGALVDENYSLAAKIMSRCLKNHFEDRALFRTEYSAEIASAPLRPKIVRTKCVKCGHEFEHEFGKYRDGICPWCSGEYATSLGSGGGQ
nr:MAG TPA: replisome organizer [Caudoviricetes sp.]